MSKTKKISRYKGVALATSIGALTLITGGLVSACGTPVNVPPTVLTPSQTSTAFTKLTPSQINLAPTLVADNFAFDGVSGTGTIRGNVVQALPSGYEYRVQNLRVSSEFVDINSINNLQEGDQININVVQSANPTELLVPTSLALEVHGLAAGWSPIAPVEFNNMLVPQAFEFTGLNGSGGVHTNIGYYLPSRYVYLVSSDRPGQQTPLPIGQIQGLQNGDTVTIQIFDTQTQLAYPYVGPLKILVQGLRDVNVTTDLAATTFTFTGMSGFGHMTINGFQLPSNFRYEVSRDNSTWLASSVLTTLINHEVIYVRLIGNDGGVTSVAERQVTVTNLTPNKTVNFDVNAQEYITRSAFTVSRIDGTLHVNPGYEIPAGYEYRVYVKRQAEGNPNYRWPRPEEVRGLLPDDAMSINLYNITSGTQVLVGDLTVTAQQLYTTNPYLQENFFDVQGGQITVNSPIALPPEMQYEFWESSTQKWVGLDEINANGGIPTLTSLEVRIIDNTDPANPTFTYTLTIPWEDYYLQPDFFRVSDGKIVVTAPQPLPDGLSYQYWVSDAQGWTSIENVQNVAVGATVYVKIVGTFESQSVNTAYIEFSITS